MGKNALRLYAPFIAIAVIQALFITVAPSEPATRQVAGVAGTPFTGGVGQGVSPGDGAVGGFDPVTGAPTASGPAGTSTGGFVGAPTGGTGGTSTGPGTTGGTQPGTNGGTQAAAGDTSHCKGEYQFDHLHANPPCVPKWTGTDNGGATYQGVTKDTIKIVFFQAEANPAVNSILGAQGLARTDEEMAALTAAAIDFINANYELYGRKVNIVVRTGSCPQTPPDVDACLAAANKVIKEDKPFMVLWDSGLYPDVFNEFARNGIVAVGGWHFSEEFFIDFRPYRYDVFMDGTKSVRMLAEYYCKNLAGGNATHSGQLIHQSIGARGAVRRRLGILVPEVDANVRTAQLLRSLITKCDSGAQPPTINTYESNIETAQQQTSATVQKMIADKITTVTCLCDPIAPAVATKGFTEARFFPELLSAGIGLLDFDQLGRLYDSEQMAHMFGVSHLQVQPRHEDSDASRMYRAAGRSGTPCKACNLPWAYMALSASMIMGAGPNLTPANIEAGVQASPGIGGWERTGGNPHVVNVSFAPGDYTGIDDVKEVYWSETAVSTIDGQPPAYVNLNGGQRYTEGRLPGDFASRIPVAAR